MKNLIIAVWGSPGAGTSTFSAALTKGLTKFSSFILLCNTDPFIPAYAVWNILAGTKEADARLENAEPIRRLFMSGNITPAFVQKRLAFHPNFKQIALLGGFSHERYEQYDTLCGEKATEAKSNAVNAFLGCVREMCQITVVDCMQPQIDVFSLRALEKADVIITLIEPNARGVAFQYSQAHILSSMKQLSSEKIILAAKVGHATPVEDFEYGTGIHFDARLPYTQDARLKLECLSLFSEYGGEYGKTVNAMVQAVKEVMSNDGNAIRAV